MLQSLDAACNFLQKYNSSMENSIFYFLPELLSVLTFLCCVISILFAAKFFGKYGLYVYSAIVTITANIQVLKLTKYTCLSDPIALGTVLFSTTFAVDNILVEYYGTKSARRGLYLSFCGYLFFVIVMQIAVLHPIVLQNDCVNMHAELEAIFSPSFYIFISSLLAYFAGQCSDIFIYSSLKKLMQKGMATVFDKHIELRSIISMAISTFVDNFVFSLFAWIVFAEHPISLSQLWKTYIFIAYILRLMIAAMCVPLVRSAGKFIKTDD